jgi:MipA family protein
LANGKPSGCLPRTARSRCGNGRLFAVASSVLALALAGSPQPASAADETPPKTTNSTIVTLGGYGIYQPTFEGSRDYELTFRPVVGLRTPGSRVWLDVPDDGLDYEFIETSNFRAGAVGNFRFSRDTDTLAKPAAGQRGFRRVGKVDISVEAGGFAEYWPADFIRTRLEVRGAVVGAAGVVADLGADFVARPTNRLTLTAGPRVSFADQDFMDVYYGVTAAQSAATGIAQFKANAGLRSFGAITSAQYKWTDDLTSIAFLQYNRLAGSAGESSLIDDRGTVDQFQVGLGLKYAFRVDW